MKILPWIKSAPHPAHRKLRKHPFAPLQDEINHLFDDFFTPDLSSINDSSMSSYAPVTDIIDQGNQYQVIAELPGMSVDDIDVSVENGYLTINCERNEESEDKEQDYVLRESWSGFFYRSLALPENIDHEKDFSASFKRGKLNITLPKLKDAETKAHKIKINGD